MNAAQKRRRIGGLATLVFFGSIGGLIPSPAAAGPVTCTYDADTKTVTATASDSSNQLSISREGDEIEASGVDCGEATRFNTDEIIVNDVPDHVLAVFVQLGNGPFRPGATDEPGSSDEIEMELNLGSGSNQFYAREGRNLTVGLTFIEGFVFERRVNLNASESTGVDHDVLLNAGLTSLSFSGTSGEDRFSAAGGAGTGSAYLFTVLFEGLRGRDVLIGGGDVDHLTGYRGADKVRGGADDDDLEGNLGDDVLRGAGGGDKILAGGGRDGLNGGPGNDELDGGPGIDECDGGVGTNTLTNCE